MGLGERPNLSDVLFAKVLERRGGLLQGRDGLLQSRLCVGLVDGDLLAVDLQACLLLAGQHRLGADVCSVDANDLPDAHEGRSDNVQ